MPEIQDKKREEKERAFLELTFMYDIFRGKQGGSHGNVAKFRKIIQKRQNRRKGRGKPNKTHFCGNHSGYDARRIRRRVFFAAEDTPVWDCGLRHGGGNPPP
ncbi:MAG: hypothetical protein LBR94_04835 [Desulfovibrio sp.]|jgi:hypothetical protein|nr:hypothetical protein [Desulfovibrio sp.]